MPESFREFFSSGFFMPHGHCYLWQPGIVWLEVTSNGVIALSYVALSVSLAYLVYRLKDEIPFKAMYLAFGAFIVLCGLTHVLDVLVIWKPVYWVDGSVRGVTAAVSAGTALLFPGLIPHARVLARGAKAVRTRGLELETAIRDLETMYQRTKELDELKSQFFANVSHELRTPLALILGPVEKHLVSGALTREQRRDLEIVARNARMLQKHVEDLLDAARLEAGKLKLEYAYSDVAQLVRLTASNFAGLAEERTIEYRVEAPASTVAQVDSDKVQRILLNLLSNAFKFTPKNGKIVCSVSVAQEDAGGTDSTQGRLVVSVADSGPGIPESQRAAVFERFRQLDGGATRFAGGTGLGLSIAKDFVELHGGTISIGDAAGGGALFTVELPVVAPAGVVVRAAAAESRHRVDLTRQAIEELRQRVDAVPSVQEKGKPLVLVVEDNPDMNRFVCEALAVDFRTRSALDGSDGLAAALSSSPDLILTDLMMPGVGGEELVHEVRARSELHGVPIVLLTARADDDLRLKLLREGAQDYLTKPFSADELRARVGNLVTLKLAQDVLREAKVAAETANRELEAFSYSVSHDLRAPLRALDGYSRLLLEDHAERLDDGGKDYLERIGAEARRMGRLIDDLLALSRVTRAEISRAKVDLSGIAHGIVERLRAADQERAVDVKLDDDLMTNGDERLLQIALENLLNNAWKFTRKRDGARIEIGRTRLSGEAVFFIRDNGAGFDMAYANKLFGAFQRLHNDREFEGTGIGLATVQRIVDRHGGRVWAEGAVGEGASFYFTLPAGES